MSDEIWSLIQPVSRGKECPFCGQKCHPAKMLCDMCTKHMNTMVLSICRNLLMKVDTKPEKPDKTKPQENIREVAIAKVLEDFPYKLAEQTRRYEKALRAEGVWFSHLVAYCLIKDLRKNKETTPFELLQDLMYIMPRDQFFEFLKNPKKNEDQDYLEMIFNFYFIPQASLDARRAVFMMLLELEKSGRLKIIRPKTNCVKCGAELSGHQYICDACKEKEIEETRDAIVSNVPPPIKSKPDLVENLFRGMYLGSNRREKS